MESPCKTQTRQEAEQANPEVHKPIQQSFDRQGLMSHLGARITDGPAVTTTLRNTAIGFHKISGGTSIARATRRANRRPHALITAVTSNNPRTQ